MMHRGGGNYFGMYEKNKTLYGLPMTIVQLETTMYKFVHAYRSQEPSSWLLLTKVYLLDSLLRESFCLADFF